MSGIQNIAIVLACSIITISSCSSKTKADDAAAEAAKAYYDSLRNGGYEYFTSMSYRPEKIPDSYKEQLVANIKMYLDDLNKTHKGIKDIKVLSCKNDSLHNTAEAYLLFSFNDSTKEEIIVPMVKRSNKWLMR